MGSHETGLLPGPPALHEFMGSAWNSSSMFTERPLGRLEWVGSEGGWNHNSSRTSGEPAHGVKFTLNLESPPPTDCCLESVTALHRPSLESHWFTTASSTKRPSLLLFLIVNGETFIFTLKQKLQIIYFVETYFSLKNKNSVMYDSFLKL